MGFAVPVAACLAAWDCVSGVLGLSGTWCARDWRSPDRFGQLAQVESGGGQQELVPGACHAPEAEAAQTDDPFHVGEDDLSAVCFSNALRLKPDYIMAHVNLARTIHWTGRAIGIGAAYRSATG